MSVDKAVYIVRRELSCLRDGLDPRIAPLKLDELAHRIVVALSVARDREGESEWQG